MSFCGNLASIKGEAIHIGINNEAISGHEVAIALEVFVPVFVCSYQSSSAKIGLSKYPVKRSLPSSCNQAIFRCSVPISDWICKNGAKDLHPYRPFSPYDFTQLLGRFQAMLTGKKERKESEQ